MLKKAAFALTAVSLATVSPAFVYLYDDGVTDNQLTTSGPATFNVAYLTQYTIAPGGTTLTSIDIVWGSRTIPNLPNGLSADVLLMDDPNGDGNPNDATVLQAISATTINVGTDTFNNYALSPATMSVGTNFFVGAFIRNVPTGSAWVGLDDDAIGMAGRNWWNVVVPGPTGAYNQLSIFGNDFTLMTRANAVPEPAGLCVLALGAAALVRRRRAKATA